MIADLAARIRAAASTKPRFLVGIFGPPASGQSTLAAELETALGPDSIAVPMDGYHLDDAILNARGHRARKGAPHTFDPAGYRALLERIKSGEPDIYFPTFDRDMELSRNAARVVTSDQRIILCEGNYLLLDLPVWRDLKSLFDLTIGLRVPLEELERRSLQRWVDHGKTPTQAHEWIAGNDMPNIMTVIEGSMEPDVWVDNYV